MCTVIVPTADVMSAAENQVEESPSEEEPKGTKRKISLSNCGVCESEEAKYRCPACHAYSCSLQCVKKHKEDSGCSGIRNKSAFVPLSQFDEMTLLSDYRFLEDTGRFTDGTTRDSLIRTPRVTLKAKKLAASARKMNITLRFLPITFTKSRENSTFYLTKEQVFLWHLKLIFPQSSSEFSQRRVSDKQTLQQILTPYIHPTESDPVTRQKLKMYVHTPFDHVKVFMKAEGRKANSVRYHELDIHKSLRDNLSYKMLIEYPVLHVVLRDHWKDYPLKGPAPLYHVLVSPAETSRLPAPLFFTMATCYPSGNEGVLHSITHTNLTSTPTVSKKRIKHGLLLNSDLMSCEMTEDEKTGDQPVVFPHLSVGLYRCWMFRAKKSHDKIS